MAEGGTRLDDSRGARFLQVSHFEKDLRSMFLVGPTDMDPMEGL